MLILWMEASYHLNPPSHSAHLGDAIVDLGSEAVAIVVIVVIFVVPEPRPEVVGHLVPPVVHGLEGAACGGLEKRGSVVVGW